MDINKQKIIDAWERCKKCDMSVIASEEGRKAYIECEYTTGLYCRQDMLVNDTVALLKEQEGIVPYIDIDEAKCPVCKVKLTRQELIGDDVLIEDFFDYCPHCGKPVLWEVPVP